MPRKKKEVLKTCGKIETQFPAHVTQTEIAISKLKDAELIDPKTVSYYATKLRECRERIGLTETSVGNLLNLSHVSIVGYENALRPRASIDRTYLKLFALIYDVSPLYLVGKTDNPLDYTGEFPVEKFLPTITEPIMFALSCANSTPRPPALIYADEAVMALYKDGVLASKEDRELMQVFLRICDAKDKRHEVIKNALFGIPLIQRLFQKIGDEAFAKERRTDIKSNRCERITEKDPYHILETIFTLEKLGYKDLDLLKCFLAITRGTPEEKVIGLTQAIVPNTNVIRIIDRDDRSENEVEELSEKGIKVLDRRHLESYLLDDEIIKKWCATVGKAELENSALTIKQQAINASISRGNATDDIKSASNDIVTNIKKLLGLTACGNNGEAIIRDTITPLITPDTQVYQQLERLIFG